MKLKDEKASKRQKDINKKKMRRFPPKMCMCVSSYFLASCRPIISFVTNTVLCECSGLKFPLD